MIELRKKKNLFHECIRKTTRQSFKAQVRKSLLSSQKRQKIIHQLEHAFWFLNTSTKVKQNFWTVDYLPNVNKYPTIYNLISSACQSAKLMMCEYEKDPDTIIEIKQYLFDNIPFLIPPPQLQLQEMPNIFVEFCLYILRGTCFTTEEKQDFVERLNPETINICLLNYFSNNWEEVTLNKCHDIMLTFFNEMIQFKNIFKRYVYNNSKFEFMLKLLIQEIFGLTRVEREIYQRLQSPYQELFDNFMHNTSNYGIIGLNLRKNPIEQETNNFVVLSKSLFLSNLLLLSPIPNYNIKETKLRLKAILNHLYRKFFLNKESQICQAQVQFCISVLLSKTIGVDFYNQFQMIDAVIKSGLKRQNQRAFNFQEEIHETPQIITPKDVLYQQSQNISNQNFEFFVNKIKLFMLCEASEELQQLKFDQIEKWLTHQIRNQQNNIFSLQNPELMCQLLRLLTNVLENHSKQKYNSYDSRRNHIKNRTQDGLLVKIKICKLIGKNGFDQLFQHQNLKFYAHELLEFLMSLLQGLKQYGDISSSIEILFYNSETLTQSLGRKYLQKSDHQDYGQLEMESNLYMSMFKSHIYSLCLKFLQRSYKLMEYKKKEKILLNLILVDFLTFEDCTKYLTCEEGYRFKKNAFDEQDCYQKDEHMERESSGQSEREGNNDDESLTYFENFQFEGKFDESKTWHTSEFRYENDSFNIPSTKQKQYHNIFSQSNRTSNKYCEKPEIEI